MLQSAARKLNINAHAKINLTLDIVGRRPDGYHNIHTVMQSVELCDVINISLSTATDKDNINLSCTNPDEYPDIPWNEKNLAYKAALLMINEYHKKYPDAPYANINITVIKNIPSGAGMAGGSCDAAGVINGLNVLLGLDYPKDKLSALGVTLGADIPFCINEGTMLCEGIGELLTPLSAPSKLPVIILKPEASISTKLIYEHVDKYTEYSNKHFSVPDLSSYENILKSMHNIMEIPSELLCADVTLCKAALIDAGAEKAMMTGSGSAVFAIVENDIKAEKIYSALLNDKRLENVKKYMTRLI